MWEATGQARVPGVSELVPGAEHAGRGYATFSGARISGVLTSQSVRASPWSVVVTQGAVRTDIGVWASRVRVAKRWPHPESLVSSFDALIYVTCSGELENNVVIDEVAIAAIVRTFFRDLHPHMMSLVHLRVETPEPREGDPVTLTHKVKEFFDHRVVCGPHGARRDVPASSSPLHELALAHSPLFELRCIHSSTVPRCSLPASGQNDDAVATAARHLFSISQHESPDSYSSESTRSL